jgi:predicted methyltransferase
MKAWHIGIGAAVLIAAPVIAATHVSPASFASVVADGGRPAEDKVRDADRKPAEMLAFAARRSPKLRQVAATSLACSA